MEITKQVSIRSTPGYERADDMAKHKDNPGSSAVATAPAREPSSLAGLGQAATPEQVGAELAKMFQVRRSEVAILRVENNLLKFLFPEELKTAGTIPVSSSSAVAAHTATTKKVELYNNFTRVKHVSIFETVKLSNPENSEEPQAAVIQKLMSAPVLGPEGSVLGVVQVSRKGYDLQTSGPDFTLDDLQRLESASVSLAKVGFLQKKS